MRTSFSILLFSICIQFRLTACIPSKPHIVIILVDDLGWNDVSWHNSQVVMPNIAALADKGVVFEQHYSQPTCSPSRSALLTGRYASRTGFQFIPQNSLEPVGLPTDFPLMPGLLQELGYEAHGLGKWHLGYCSPEYLPNNRGFTSYNGLWNGAGDHLLHFIGANFTDIQGSLGFDFHLNDRIQLGAVGRWSTDIFVDRVADLLAARAGLDQPLQGAVHVENEDQDKPLMLYLAYQEPHAPLMVDPKYEALYPEEEEPSRRTYLGMVSSVDDSVGRIVQMMRDYTYTDPMGEVRSMYDDTVFLFSSDNGGMSEGLGYAGGDNSPLRGRKGDMWEGGCRVPAFITGPHINATGVSSALVHLTDWLPTLYRLGGGDVRDLGDIDGIDQLPVIRGEVEPLREEILYDIANFENRNLTINVPSTWPNSTLELSGSFGAALRIGDFKLVVGCTTIIGCSSNYNSTYGGNTPKDRVLLFDLSVDPGEQEDLSDQMPELVQVMQERLEEHLDRAVAPFHLPEDRAGLPSNHFPPGQFFTGWCEAQARPET